MVFWFPVWYGRESAADMRIVDSTRVWWVQAEAVVSFLNCYAKTGEEKYRTAAEDLWSYIKEYMIDRFLDLNRDQKPESRKPIVESWKCPCLGTLRLDIMSYNKYDKCICGQRYDENG